MTEGMGGGGRAPSAQCSGVTPDCPQKLLLSGSGTKWDAMGQTGSVLSQPALSLAPEIWNFYLEVSRLHSGVNNREGYEVQE